MKASLAAGLTAAIAAAGTRQKLAAIAKVKPQAVSQWDAIPVARVLAVEAGTGIHRSTLRPDYYPPEPERPSVAA